MSPMHHSKAASILLRGHNGSMTFVAFISDDQVVSASDDKTIRRWNLSDKNNKVVKEPVSCALTISPNGHWLVMGGRDGRVRLVDLETPTLEVTKSVGRHKDVIKSLSFSPDSTQLATGAQDGTMFIWSSTTLEQVTGPFEGHTDAVWWVCYSLDGSRIASCDRAVIQVRDTATWGSVTIIEEKAWSLAWSSDGRLFAGCIDGTIKIYNPSNGMLRATCSGHNDVVFSIALSHNTKFFATASWDKTIRLWEAMTFQQIGPNLQHDAQVHSISISPDDSHLVSGAREPNIRVWNLRNLAPNLFKDFPLEPLRGPVCSSSPSAFHIVNLTLLHDRRSLPSSCFQTGVYITGTVAQVLMYLRRASIQWVVLISLLNPGFRPRGYTNTRFCKCSFHCCIRLIFIVSFQHNETLDHSDHSSTKSNFSTKGGIWDLFRQRTPQVDMVRQQQTLRLTRPFDAFFVQTDDPRTSSVRSYPSPQVH